MLEVKKVKFTGNLVYDENETLVRTGARLGTPGYTGPPSPEVDSAWEDLLEGERSPHHYLLALWKTKPFHMFNICSYAF